MVKCVCKWDVTGKHVLIAIIVNKYTYTGTKAAHKREWTHCVRHGSLLLVIFIYDPAFCTHFLLLVHPLHIVAPNNTFILMFKCVAATAIVVAVAVVIVDSTAGFMVWCGCIITYWNPKSNVYEYRHATERVGEIFMGHIHVNDEISCVLFTMCACACVFILAIYANFLSFVHLVLSSFSSIFVHFGVTCLFFHVRWVALTSAIFFFLSFFLSLRHIFTLCSPTAHNLFKSICSFPQTTKLI